MIDVGRKIVLHRTFCSEIQKIQGRQGSSRRIGRFLWHVFLMARGNLSLSSQKCMSRKSHEKFFHVHMIQMIT